MISIRQAVIESAATGCHKLSLTVTFHCLHKLTKVSELVPSLVVTEVTFYYSKVRPLVSEILNAHTVQSSQDVAIILIYAYT